MPYTLATNWIFFAIALILGALFGGWVAKKFCKCDDSALRAEIATLKISHDENKANVLSLTSDLDAAKVKAAAGAADSQKVSGLLSRIAELEASSAVAAVPVAAAVGAAGLAVGAATLADTDGGSASADALTADAPATAVSADASATSVSATSVSATSASADAVGTSDAAGSVANTAAVAAGSDLAAASAVLGQPVALNDIIVIDGIGPAIKELLHGSGITTWEQVASTPTTKLQELLTAGGPNFASADPATWPEQARLLVAGDWAGFKALVDTLDHGSPKV